MPSSTTIPEFMDFIRRHVGCMENVTNGNRIRLDANTVELLRPEGINEPKLIVLIHQVLHLKVEYSDYDDHYEFYYDPP